MFGAAFNLDRRPVDLAGLGLAADEVRVLGSARQVALLRSAASSSIRDRETSPIRRLGEGLWVVGRLRLDGRAEIGSRLDRRHVGDPLLCLHAYEKWGGAFAEQLAGDFCLVLWDEARGRLIAVRDQLGVRSLFHARAGNTVLVSDSLPWLASCNALSHELDDYWIADFLSFHHSLDFDRTVYRDIRRLPPAHVVSFSEQQTEQRRYWNLELPEPLYLRDRRLYGEHLRELTTRAIADRLSAGRVGVSMSGGLDSTTLAACAVTATGSPDRVIARCFHFETQMADDEARLATLAARHLGISLDLTAVDEAAYDPMWRSHFVSTAEPWVGVVRGLREQATLQSMAGSAEIWFEGEGPDNALRFERDPYLAWLIRQRRWGRLAEAAWLYLRAKGWGGWRETVRRYLGPAQAPLAPAALPAWLSRDLVERLHLEERLAVSERGPQPPHPWHPAAMASFRDPIWQGIFSDCDTEETLAPLAWRHPYLDLRVLQFMLALPPVPWARRKLVLREAMQARLPDEILGRDKTPLQADPSMAAMRNHKLAPLAIADGLERWIDAARWADAERAGAEPRRLLYAHALDYWLAAR